MSAVVDVQEAKTRLSELLDRAERGEDVVIALAGRPVARLVPVERPTSRNFGTMAFDVPASFFEPLPGEEIDAWE